MGLYDEVHIQTGTIVLGSPLTENICCQTKSLCCEMKDYFLSNLGLFYGDQRYDWTGIMHLYNENWNLFAVIRDGHLVGTYEDTIDAGHAFDAVTPDASCDLCREEGSGVIPVTDDEFRDFPRHTMGLTRWQLRRIRMALVEHSFECHNAAVDEDDEEVADGWMRAETEADALITLLFPSWKPKNRKI